MKTHYYKKNRLNTIVKVDIIYFQSFYNFCDQWVLTSHRSILNSQEHLTILRIGGPIGGPIGPPIFISTF